MKLPINTRSRDKIEAPRLFPSEACVYTSSYVYDISHLTNKIK
jgi:hypothetical protein